MTQTSDTKSSRVPWLHVPLGTNTCYEARCVTEWEPTYYPRYESQSQSAEAISQLGAHIIQLGQVVNKLEPGRHADPTAPHGAIQLHLHPHVVPLDIGCSLLRIDPCQPLLYIVCLKPPPTVNDFWYCWLCFCCWLACKALFISSTTVRSTVGHCISFIWKQ